MPGAGDSVQALKAGIMEIPDVIAINKLDHPRATATAADVRQVLALGREPPPIVLDRGAARRGSRRALDGDRRHRSRSRGRRAPRGAACAEPRGRGVRGRLRTGPPTSGECGLRRPELLRLLDEVRRRELDPLTAVHEILEKVFHIDDEDRPRPSLTSRPPASGSASHARVTPVYGSETLLRETGPPVGCSRPRTSSGPARSRSAAR